MSFGDMGETSLYTFVKFPGNRALISGSNLYKNMPKPFRTSELYLIVAEASDALSKPVDANAALKAIRGLVSMVIHTLIFQDRLSVTPFALNVPKNLSEKDSV